MSLLTFCIFVLGSLTVILSLVVAHSFFGHHDKLEGKPRRLTIAISWQLVGESIIGFGTLAFATAAHFGFLPDWSTELQSFIRFVMFFATSATTLHLYATMRRM